MLCVRLPSFPETGVSNGSTESYAEARSLPWWCRRRGESPRGDPASVPASGPLQPLLAPSAPAELGPGPGQYCC